jgi:hypothetical protein
MLSRKVGFESVIRILALASLFAVVAPFVLAQDGPPENPQPQNPVSNSQQNQDSPQTSPDQQTPDKNASPPVTTAAPAGQTSPQKKDENGNPLSDVSDETKQVAVAGLRKVRDWEVGVIAGTYVSKNRPLAPLTAKQREYLYLQDTLTTPATYLKRMFEAAVDQARGSPRQWGGGWEGYGKRFASREGQFVISNSIAEWGDAKLGYEVRYEQCRCSGFWLRARHAIARNFYTYNITEEEKRPQWALYGGALGAGMLSAAWKPNHAVLGQGVSGVTGQAAWGTLLNLFIEFAPDINRKLGAKK